MRLLLLGALTLTSVRAADLELLREHFDDADLLRRGWYDGTAFQIAGSSRLGPGCIEFAWPSEATTPFPAKSARRPIAPVEEVFVRFYLKFSTDWGWSGRSYHPHLLHFLTSENSKFHGPAASHLTLYLEPVNGRLRLAATDIQNLDAAHGLTQGALKGGFNGQHFDSRERLFTDDRWHCIEAQFRLNSLDAGLDRPNRDGIVRGGFDGKLVIEQLDVVLRSTDFPKMKLNQFLMTPYFGPGLLPHAQKLWIDELVVSTARVGPLNGEAPAAGPVAPAK